MNTVVFSMIRISAYPLGKSVSWIPTIVVKSTIYSNVLGWNWLQMALITYFTGKLTPVLYKTDALLTVYWLSPLLVYTVEKRYYSAQCTANHNIPPTA